MRYRKRQRVDWDEEIRKTEQIRRKGFFISALGFGVALVFIFGTSFLGGNQIGIGAELSRTLIFVLLFVLSMFVLSITLRRRARLKRELQEKKQEQEFERIRLETKKLKNDM